MAANVVTISRTLGAGGEALGQQLAAALGFRYVDSEIIDRASAQAGVTPAEIARVEARKGLLARIIENLGRTGSGALAAGGVPEVMAVDTTTQTYEQLIIDVVRETAAEGKVVIVAHGAAIPLAGTPGLLRVLVDAPRETRIARIAKDEGMTAVEAGKKVDDSDHARADYFRRFYQLDHEGPLNYDIVLNTEALSPATAARCLVELARA